MSSRSMVFLFLLGTFLFAAGAKNEDRECAGIGKLLKGKGFTYPWWEKAAAPIIPTGCPVGSTGPKNAKCCPSFDTRKQKDEMSHAFTENWLGPKLAGFADSFKDRKKKFDETFKALLTRAHTSFHAMFERTYGMLYIQHAHVFHALFTTLEGYYDTGKDKLETKLNEFFAILTRKMFEVLNAQYEFDEAYLSCAAIVISEKQGNEIHRQIVSSLRRSFVATKALAQGLQDAEKAINNLKKLELNEVECINPVSKMLHCPICSEQRAYKPCPQYCVNVSTRCMSSTLSLGKPWTEFSVAMEGIIDRLLGPYNVEAVVEPIHIKISEAIMNFQESGPDLSQAVFAKCGKPKLKSSRLRRDAPVAPLTQANVGTAKNNRRGGGGGGGGGEDRREKEAREGEDKSLEKLLRELKGRVRKGRGIWEALPRQVCHAISKSYSSQLCWNGTAAVKPDRSNKSEEERFLGRGPPSQVVADQIILLQHITEKLRAAFNGFDVQWQTELDDIEDGSGQGSGSGDIPADLEDDDDDDPNGQIKGKPMEKPFKPIERIPQAPTYPRRPSGPPPAILHPSITEEEGEDEDEEDENELMFNKPQPGLPTGGGGGSSIDFGNYVPPPTPPKINIRYQKPTMATTTTTTIGTTTKRPNKDVDVTRTGGGANKLDETGKTIAVFKLFAPVVVSMIGKMFSFS